jgi:hypothetical protein
MRNSFYAVLLLAAAAACGRGDRATPENDTAASLGTCTQEEPGTPPVDGNALYAVDRTATAGGAAEGRFATMITCTTPGPGGSAVALILPNLTDSLPRPGRYRIHAPGVLPARDSLARLAWAEAMFPATHGLTYRGMGGELVIEKVEDGALVGSYLVALERAPEAEARGPEKLVLGGGFAAPRNRRPLGAAQPGAGQ